MPTLELEKEVKWIASPRDLIQLMRPHQWVKNLFVFPAPLFGHALTHFEPVLLLGVTFIAFCLLSSAVYVFNDVLDYRHDRTHPSKRTRPIAAGRVGTKTGVVFGLVLCLLALALSWTIGTALGIVALLYLANNVAYFVLFKKKVVADVLSIALGFLLRILAGAHATGIEPSSWLVVCGFSLALFLGFCKRRSEIGLFDAGSDAEQSRAVLNVYSEDKLNLLCTSTATIAIVTYMLFTVSPATIETHGTTYMIYTSPFVVYAVFRYLMKALELRAEDASTSAMRDPGFIAAGLGWIGSAAWIIYALGNA